MANTRQYRDRSGRVWETHGNHFMAHRVTLPDGRTPLTPYSAPLARVRDALGPLTPTTTEDNMTTPEPREGDQFRDRDGDIWRVMRNGKMRVYGRDADEITHGYETTEGWADAARVAARPNITRTPNAERAPFVPPLHYAPVGAAYRDSEDDLWYRTEDGDRWVMDWVEQERPYGGSRFARIDADFGPLTRVPDEDKRGRTMPVAGPDTVTDASGDTWYRMGNGRYTMYTDRTHDRGGRTFAYIRDMYGPLSIDTPGTATPTETSDQAEEALRPDAITAWNKAVELLNTIPNSLSTEKIGAHDIVHLARFLMED